MGTNYAASITVVIQVVASDDTSYVGGSDTCRRCHGSTYAACGFAFSFVRVGFATRTATGCPARASGSRSTALTTCSEVGQASWEGTISGSGKL